MNGSGFHYRNDIADTGRVCSKEALTLLTVLGAQVRDGQLHQFDVWEGSRRQWQAACVVVAQAGKRWGGEVALTQAVRTALPRAPQGSHGNSLPRPHLL